MEKTEADLENLLTFIDNYHDRETDCIVSNIWEGSTPAKIEDKCSIRHKVLSPATKSSPQIDAVRVELTVNSVSVKSLVKVFTDSTLRPRWSRNLKTYKLLDRPTASNGNNSNNSNISIEYCLYNGIKKPLTSYLLERKDYIDNKSSPTQFVSTWESVEWNDLLPSPQLWQHYFSNQSRSKMEKIFESGIHFKKINNNNSIDHPLSDFNYNYLIKITLVCKYTNSTGFSTPQKVAAIELNNLKQLVKLAKSYDIFGEYIESRY